MPTIRSQDVSRSSNAEIAFVHKYENRFEVGAWSANDVKCTNRISFRVAAVIVANICLELRAKNNIIIIFAS